MAWEIPNGNTWENFNDISQRNYLRNSQKKKTNAVGIP